MNKEEGLSILENMTIEDATAHLDSLISEKAKAIETIDIAVNEHLALKNQYITKSNEIRINPTQIQEEMGLNKIPTEKQQQAHIDDKLKDLLQDIKISEENVKSWKRKVDLLDDKITAEKYRVKMLMVILNGVYRSYDE